MTPPADRETESRWECEGKKKNLTSMPKQEQKEEEKTCSSTMFAKREERNTLRNGVWLHVWWEIFT